MNSSIHAKLSEANQLAAQASYLTAYEHESLLSTPSDSGRNNANVQTGTGTVEWLHTGRIVVNERWRHPHDAQDEQRQQEEHHKGL